LKKSKSESDHVKHPEWEVIFSSVALHQLERLPSDIAQDIIDKIEWLSSDVEHIRHARLKGCREFSLHSGQYRIIYAFKRLERRIEILDMGKHDEVYRRLRN
jgi:mRNA-degrading endonuclease RelE of RelBE toxin-antitoxin system